MILADAALIDRALAIAVEAYRGKTDKAGEAYVLHPLRLMMKFTDDDARITALLHDVIEDSDHTVDSLRAAGVPDHVVDAVEKLSRHADESYEDFILRLAPDKLARRVKLADIEDNINLLRLKSVSQSDLARVAKYHAAWCRLKSVGE
jgi:(p)ppGpp synthase/HD superfamily hydrolase